MKGHREDNKWEQNIRHIEDKIPWVPLLCMLSKKLISKKSITESNSKQYIAEENYKE